MFRVVISDGSRSGIYSTYGYQDMSCFHRACLGFLLLYILTMQCPLMLPFVFGFFVVFLKVNVRLPIISIIQRLRIYRKFAVDFNPIEYVSNWLLEQYMSSNWLYIRTYKFIIKCNWCNNIILLYIVSIHIIELCLVSHHDSNGSENLIECVWALIGTTQIARCPINDKYYN